jgi:hypothetical protein
VATSVGINLDFLADFATLKLRKSVCPASKGVAANRANWHE